MKVGILEYQNSLEIFNQLKQLKPDWTSLLYKQHTGIHGSKATPHIVQSQLEKVLY